MTDREGSPPGKKRKLNQGVAASPITDATIPEPSPKSEVTSRFRGLERPISPPISRRVRAGASGPCTPHVLEQRQRQDQPLHRAPLEPDEGTEEPVIEDDDIGDEETKHEKTRSDAGIRTAKTKKIQVQTSREPSPSVLPSPIQLTRIKDLSPAQNADTVTLSDILDNPIIKECWNFNFLFDIDFVMKHFDSDVRSLVKVKIIHGFWKQEDERRQKLQHAAERYDNVDLIHAYIPDPFGTHHSKMLVLFRHDDTAQVIIHTANMIERDWRNMSQAVWRSPILPLLTESSETASSHDEKQSHPIGSGERFKTDLLRYLEAYGNRLKGLVAQLSHYDFSSIRAAFIGSTPSRQKPNQAKLSTQTSWGWLGLREILSSIPLPSPGGIEAVPNIVIQISSIATLGATPAWLTHFQSVLSKHSSSADAKPTVPPAMSFFNPRVDAPKIKEPKFNIIFPTAHEIRTSLDGYGSGASIHTKLQSPAQQKQLQYLRPVLCHWNHQEALDQPEGIRRAERGPAAPHIKTYIRFSNEAQRRIDWAMITSANLSKQAWGEVESKNGEIWIQSWETGVVLWPALFADSNESVEILPVFGKDLPTGQDVRSPDEKVKTVGFRMPYDLPLEPYTSDEVPWCATMAHQEPDWKGQMWSGH